MNELPRERETGRLATGVVADFQGSIDGEGRINQLREALVDNLTTKKKILQADGETVKKVMMIKASTILSTVNNSKDTSTVSRARMRTKGDRAQG